MGADVDADTQAPAKQLGGITGKGFLPGQSGNPSGRPKRLPITDRYAVIAELPVPNYLVAALKLTEAEKQEIKTYGDALALSQFRAGIKGKTEPAREIADRLEGRARQPVELSGDNGGLIQYAEIIARIRKRKAQCE